MTTTSTEAARAPSAESLDLAKDFIASRPGPMGLPTAYDLAALLDSYAAERVATLQEQLKEAREALKPFAQQAEQLPQGKEDWHYWSYHFSFGSLRRASKALDGTTTGDANG